MHQDIPLNWQTDPIYFDPQPVPVTQWLNANDLILQNRINEIFLSEKQLHLYPIMVRRNDFVRKNSSDRVMARFPFLALDEPIQELIKQKILLLSELTRDYFYKSINKTITQWENTICEYLKRNSLPFPIFRCAQELFKMDIRPNSKYIPFTSARGEAFKMPTQLSKELAYLTGMVNGDGNLQKYTLRIVDFSIKNIKQLQAMFEKYFEQTGNILYKTPNSPEVVITNLWVVRLFSFLTSQPIGTKKYAHLREPLIFQNNPTYRSYYWSGVMDADGSYKDGQVVFTSASRSFSTDFQIFLQLNNIKPTFRERNDNTFVVYIPSLYRYKLKELLVSLHPEKKKDYETITHLKTKTTAFFNGYKESSLENRYFNFRLINNLSVNGLNEILRKMRGDSSRKEFVKSITLNEKTLFSIEDGAMGINILHLEEILKDNNLQLMPFLNQQHFVRYNIRSSERTKLDTQPNEELTKLLSPLIFRKHSVNIPKTHLFLKQQIEEHFDIKLHSYKITNKVLLEFFNKYINKKH